MILVSRQESLWIRSAGEAEEADSKAAAGAGHASCAGQGLACSSGDAGAEARSGRGRACCLATSRRCSCATQVMRASVGWGATGILASLSQWCKVLGWIPSMRAPVATGKVTMIKTPFVKGQKNTPNEPLIQDMSWNSDTSRTCPGSVGTGTMDHYWY